jgi:phenylalanyl-tRNA synthetase beta subunit
LLEKTYENIKAGYKDFTLFEINQVTNKKDGLNDEKVPVMHTNLALVTLGDYYLAKKYLSELLKQLGLSEEVILEALKGHVFAVKGSVLKRFKIEQPVSGFEIDLEKLLAIIPATSVKKFKFSRFPATERDVTFAVSKDTPFGDVEKALNEAFNGKELLVTIKPVSIYEPEENLKEIKNLSFHLSIAHPEKTLNGDEISVIMDEVTKHVCKVSGGAVI